MSLWFSLDNAVDDAKTQMCSLAVNHHYLQDNATSSTVESIPWLNERQQTYEATREKVRKFINASSTAEVLFTRGTTTDSTVACYAEEVLREGTV